MHTALNPQVFSPNCHILASPALHEDTGLVSFVRMDQDEIVQFRCKIR